MRSMIALTSQNLNTSKENKASTLRKYVTLYRTTWLYPGPLELSGEPNAARFGAIFEISTGDRKKRI